MTYAEFLTIKSTTKKSGGGVNIDTNFIMRKRNNFMAMKVLKQYPPFFGNGILLVI